MNIRRTFWSTVAVCFLLGFCQAQLYQTSWEDPPFSAGGSVNGIDGWANGSGGGVSHSISTDQARTGTQSLKWDNTGTNNSFYSVYRAFTWAPEDPNNKIVVSTYVWISASTQANRIYGLYLTGSATGTLGSTILGVTIDGAGRVRAGTSWSATYSGAPIGTASPGTYTERWLKLELTYDRESNSATASVSGFGDGSTISANFIQATEPRNVNLGSDYVTTSDRAGLAYFDDLEIRLEPGTAFEGWDELQNGGGDAGDLVATAQRVTTPDALPCSTPVTRVRGDIGENDADLYVICITDPASFSASTVGTTSWDTQLWLFRCDGVGVVHNDDNPDASTGLQSRIDNRTNCIQEPGIYLLGITRYNRDAVNSLGQLIWANTPGREVRCPDGTGRNDPLAGWSGPTTSAGRYIIQLQGAYFVDANGTNGGDVNGDGCVDDADLLAVLFAFGSTGSRPEDLNCDEVVDDADLLTVLFNFGAGC